MLAWVDKFLNKISMYRLMNYYLRVLFAAVLIESLFHLIDFNWLYIAETGAMFLLVCYAANFLLAKLFRADTNYESQFITALILTLIVGPVNILTADWWLPVVIAVLAMASKYILVIRKKHLFNPAAVAVVISAIFFNYAASWWVGLPATAILVILGGLLMLRKTKWTHLVLSFLLTYLPLTLALAWYHGSDVPTLWLILKTFLITSPLLFFSFVMLPEPLTAATGSNRKRIYFGIFIGAVLFYLQNYTTIGYSFELALIIGNVFGFLISSLHRTEVSFTKQETVAQNTASLEFEKPAKLNFKPGQFIYYSLPHAGADNRGTRRYFSLASSPTESKLMLLTKFAEKGSSFKNKLKALVAGNKIIANSLDGEFVLPKNPDTKLAFIAGGVGIAPFRSMIKYLVDTKENRDIILLFSNKTEADISFRGFLEDAKKQLPLKVVYVVSEQTGPITPELIKKEIPDFSSRTFYLSGPEPMIEAMEIMIHGMGVSSKQIKTDFFPGYE